MLPLNFISQTAANGGTIGAPVRTDEAVQRIAIEIRSQNVIAIADVVHIDGRDIERAAGDRFLQISRVSPR